MEALDFTGKNVLVVGGSSGIGNGIARAFLAAGATVHIWGTRSSPEAYAGEEGSDLSGVSYAQVDAGDAQAIAAYTPPFETLDILVQSQGIALYQRQEFEIDKFRHVLDVNLVSLMAIAMKFKPMLVASGGNIINVTSSAAFHATIGNPAYNASKTGATGLTKTLAQAWAKDGIRVNGLAPGYVATRMTAVTVSSQSRLDAVLDRIPLGRLGSVAEMAGVALFLASPMSSYVTGQTILADGGMLL